MPVFRTVSRFGTRQIVLVGAIFAACILGAISSTSASAAPFAASASVSPQVHYLGSTGNVFTFTVHNIGTSSSLGAVEITRPSTSWTVLACPQAPTGWSTQRTATKCRYHSAGGAADNIPPGASNSSFQLRASPVSGTHNLTGTWTVKVSKTNDFNTPSKVTAAASEPPGLTTAAYSLRVLDAVVDPATTTPGSACPAPNKQAITASTGHTLVICGRNRTTGTLTPTATQSSLGGTFVASHGSFSSGPVAPTTTSVILGSWANVTITPTAGPNKTVVAKIGSATNQTSPLTPLTGYEALNNPPNAVDDTATTNENTSTSFDPRTNDSDPDGDPMTISAVNTTGTAGTVTITGGGTAVTYNPNGQFESLAAGESDTDTFTYTVSDSQGGTDTATVTVTITGVNDSPTAVDDTTSVGEDSAAALVDVLANDTDPDSTDTLNVSAVDTTGTAGTVTNNGTDVSYDPNGQFESLADGATGTDTFTYTVSDNNGGTDTATVTVTITGVEDAPVAVADSATVLEDASATAVPVLTNDTDADGGANLIQSVTQPANGTVVITGGGTGLTYQPDANYCNDPPGTTPDTFTYTLTPGGSTATVSMTVTCVNDAPIADNETFSGSQGAIGNTALIGNDPSDGPPTVTGPKKTITGDILDGDVDVDGPGPLVVIAGTFPTSDGGNVVIQSDGDFTFTPAPVTSCSDATDFFDYTVSDQNPSTPGWDIGRVNIVIAGCVWYVSNNAADNDGTSTAPFDTLAQAETASAAGHTIFVFDGDDTTAGYNAGIDLKPNQSLLGEAATLQFGADVLHTAIPGARPTITDTNADVVSLASNNTLRAIELDPQGTGGGIAGGAGDNGGTIDNVHVIDAGTAGTQPGLELDGTTGTWNLSGLDVVNGGSAGAIGARLNNAGTVNFATPGTNSIQTTAAKALDFAGTDLGTASTIGVIAVTGSATGGISLVNTTGTISLGDNSGADLSLTTTSGASAAFLLSNAGNVTVPGGGTSNISSTGGPAVDVSNTTGSSLALDTVSSSNSTGPGITLDRVGTGTFSATGGTLSSFAGIGFVVSGASSGAVTYAGAIGDGLNSSVLVTGRTGGTVTLSGTITDGVDAAGGIIVQTNSGGLTVISGATKTLNTGTFNAVHFVSSDGHTLSFTGGGLDIDTTSGTGVEANVSGTITVTGAANTIDTTTGRALNVLNTDIGTTDLAFQRIASIGAPNGILLNNTANAAGSLIVTGNGGTCSSAGTCTGGAIQNSTGAGIELTNVPGSASFTRMAVTSGGDDGIRATTVDDVNLVDSVVTNNGNSHAGGLEERGLDYLNVTGALLILRTTVSGSDDSNAHIRNTAAGTTTLSVDQSTFSDSKFNAGLRLRGEGPSIMNATVTGSVFSLNADPGFSMQTDASNTAQQTLLFDNNDVSGGSANAVSGRPQVSINADSASVVKATVTNNDIKSAAGAEIILNTLAAHTGTFDAKVNGNDIGDTQPGNLDPLADGGSSIWGWAHGDGVTRMEIRNNNISNWGGRAMELSLNEGNGDADYTVTENMMTAPDISANTFEGIYILAGGAGGDTSDVCVDMENNDMDGIGRQGVSDVALDRFTGNNLRFADFNDTAMPNLQMNLRARNVASPGLTVETFSLGPTATTATACNLPVGTP